MLFSKEINEDFTDLSVHVSYSKNIQYTEETENHASVTLKIELSIDSLDFSLYFRNLISVVHSLC